MKPFTALILGAAVLASGCDKPSSWTATSSGAIRADAYDYLAGKIDIVTAYKQKDVCKNYVNNLESGSPAGINGAVEPFAGYRSRDYYFYKATAYVDFYKDRAPGFHLTLYESHEYFKQPRIIPDERTLFEKLQNLSMATQMQVSQALKGQDGKPKEFTPGELASLIESKVGKQDFDTTAWVLANFFDKDTQTFMGCIPHPDKLVERVYDQNAESAIREGLTDAEKRMRNIAKG